MNSKRPRNNRNNPRRGSGQGGNRQSHSLDSNGPGIKVRGNSHQIFEKYQAMARDAHTAGDRVMEETYAQHAEHYYRLANSDGGQQRQQQQQPQQQPVQQEAGAESVDVEPVVVEVKETVEPSPRDMAKEPQPVVE